MSPVQVIKPVPGTALAEDKDEARRIRERVILPSIAAGEEVTLDFRDVQLATQSFIHALISSAIRRHGENAIRLMSFKNCSEDVRALILTVVEYTLMADAAARSGPENKPGSPGTLSG